MAIGKRIKDSQYPGDSCLGPEKVAWRGGRAQASLVSPLVPFYLYAGELVSSTGLSTYRPQLHGLQP